MVALAKIESDERELVRVRPSWWSVILHRLGLIVFLVALALVAPGAVVMLGLSAPGISVWCILGVAIVLIWNMIERWSRMYVLTDRRVVRTTGVLRRLTTEIHLRDVEHVVLVRTVRERLAGVGTIGVASAGTGSIELAWVMVDRPKHRLDAIRSAADTWRTR